MRRASCPLWLAVAAVFAVTLIAGPAGAATLYRWVDDRGVVHVSESPPEERVGAAQAIAGEDADKGSKAGPAAEKKEFRVRPAEVTIYTTPTCPWCHRAKAWLRDKKIRYREIDITSDRSGLDEMVKISGQTGVPVIDVGGEVIVGFNQSRLNEIFRE